jgi:hypothetical protein
VTLEEFQSLRELENRRVRMTFSDGQIVIATLVKITSDLDESRHIVYDDVEWSALPHSERKDCAWYAPGEDLLSCVSWSPEVS